MVVHFKSQEAASLNRQSPDDIKPQPISSEKIVKTLLDLHAKDQLNPQCLKNDYECIVKSVVKVYKDFYYKLVILFLLYCYRGLLTTLVSQINLTRQLVP